MLIFVCIILIKMEKEKYAIIVAGGTGVRMGSSIPKQFIEINGKPIIRYTIERFLSLDFPVRIALVLPSESKEYWKNYCRQNDFLPSYFLTSGGYTRFHSVKNALCNIPDGAVVAVHDGVRPFVSKEFLQRLFEEAENNEAVVPAVSPVDSVREKDGARSYSLDRSRIMLVQTPQLFHSEVLKKAYMLPFSPAFTDDASVVEAAGYSITLTDGIRGNMKITTPEDLKYAQAVLSGISE